MASKQSTASAEPLVAELMSAVAVPMFEYAPGHYVNLTQVREVKVMQDGPVPRLHVMCNSAGFGFNLERSATDAAQDERFVAFCDQLGIPVPELPKQADG